MGLLPDTWLRVAHAPGMPGTFSPRPRVSDPDMHHDTCVTHVSWCMPGSLTSGFLWNRWRGKRSRHSRRMRNPQFYVSGKRPITVGGMSTPLLPRANDIWMSTSWISCSSSIQNCTGITSLHIRNPSLSTDFWSSIGIFVLNPYSKIRHVKHASEFVLNPSPPVVRFFRTGATSLGFRFVMFCCWISSLISSSCCRRRAILLPTREFCSPSWNTSELGWMCMPSRRYTLSWGRFRVPLSSITRLRNSCLLSRISRARRFRLVDTGLVSAGTATCSSSSKVFSIEISWFPQRRWFIDWIVSSSTTPVCCNRYAFW